MVGNKELVETLYLTYEPYIRKLCSYKLKNIPDKIDDCVQETFAALAESLNNGIEIAHPKAWLTSVANNIIRDTFSQNAKDREKLTELDANKIDEVYSYNEDDVTLFNFDEKQVLLYKEQIIMRLNDDERDLLNERYVQKKSIKSMADERNTTKNNIYQKFLRLRLKTKMLIKEVLGSYN